MTKLKPTADLHKGILLLFDYITAYSRRTLRNITIIDYVTGYCRLT